LSRQPIARATSRRTLDCPGSAHATRRVGLEPRRSKALP
jgi:hypothetical protein